MNKIICVLFLFLLGCGDDWIFQKCEIGKPIPPELRSCFAIEANEKFIKYRLVHYTVDGSNFVYIYTEHDTVRAIWQR